MRAPPGTRPALALPLACTLASEGACRPATSDDTIGSPTLAFARWAPSHAHALRLQPLDSSVSDLAPLGDMVRDARFVAFGEPFHGGHEPLLMRNRIIKYLVTER